MYTKIPQLRKKRKLSQGELGTVVGVTRRTITSIETGKYVAFLPLAYKTAHYLDRTIEDVLDFTNLEESKRMDSNNIVTN